LPHAFGGVHTPCLRATSLDHDPELVDRLAAALAGQSDPPISTPSVAV
jgi:hypothetical protein